MVGSSCSSSENNQRKGAPMRPLQGSVLQNYRISSRLRARCSFTHLHWLWTFSFTWNKSSAAIFLSVAVLYFLSLYRCSNQPLLAPPFWVLYLCNDWWTTHSIRSSPPVISNTSTSSFLSPVRFCFDFRSFLTIDMTSFSLLLWLL